MKNSVSAVNGLRFLRRNKFPRISEAKIKEGVLLASKCSYEK